jgi:iron-sulfur cluster assembly protein
MTILTVSDEARNYIVAMIKKQGAKNSVELSLAPQGCNGYKYEWKTVDLYDADHSVDLGDGHFILFARGLVPYILGSEVVIETAGLSKRLSITNPNEAGSCGCGESVNFDV